MIESTLLLIVTPPESPHTLTVDEGHSVVEGLVSGRAQGPFNKNIWLIFIFVIQLMGKKDNRTEYV